MKNWLALWRVPGLGPRRYLSLLNAFDSPEAVLAATASDLARCNLPQSVIDAIRQPDWVGVDQDLNWLTQPNHELMTWADADYPARLREIANPPPVLFIHGQRALLNDPQLAIVGSRNPSPVGTRNASEFAEALAQVGLVITSGMALGIDAAAHQGAMRADSGATIAIAATGLDRVYPARHRELAGQITENGALVSEFPIGTRPMAGHFPRRNRLISGLSLGVLVVEAARQSGSLVTARLAMEQGREVFAIPGSIHNPLAKGCHQLIQQGGKLVESAHDILEELKPLLDLQNAELKVESTEQIAAESLPAAYSELLDQIGFEPTSVDLLVSRSGLPARDISSMLLVLELQGYVSSSPGGCYYRTTPQQ